MEEFVKWLALTVTLSLVLYWVIYAIFYIRYRRSG
jgi:hypothetical protein